MARLRTYGIAFAALGALAIAAGAAPALGQIVDPFEEPKARAESSVFGDEPIGRRRLRGGLDPAPGGTSSRDARNSRRAGDQVTVGAARLRDPLDPFRDQPDPLRDPFREPDDLLRDPLTDIARGAARTPRRITDADDTGRGASEAEEDAYAALGVRMGSFLLFPEISVESFYDDNLFLTPDNTEGDWALVLTPSVRAESDWSRHSLVGTLSGVRSYHDRFSSEDDKTFSVGLAGRLDIRRTTNLVAEASYSQSLESRSSTDFPTGSAGRSQTRNQDFSLEGNHTFNRVTLTLRGERNGEDFEDGTGIDGLVINNDDRDLVERRLTGRVSYEFQPDVAAFVEGSINQRDFAESVDDDGTLNGSSGHDVQAGLSFQLTGKLTGEFSAGYALQTPDDAALADINGLIFNAALEWRATALTTFRLDASSEIDETTQADSAGSITRAAAVSIEHRPRHHITLGASLGYEREESSGNGDLEEELEFALTGEYNFTRSTALTAAYSHLESTSNTPDSDYSVNQVRVGVRLRR